MDPKKIIEQAGTVQNSLLNLAMRGGFMPHGLNFETPGAEGTGSDGATDDAGGGDSDDDSGDGEGDKGGEGAPTKAQFDAVLKELREERKNRKELAKQLKTKQDSGPSQAEIEELREFRVKQQKSEEDRKKKEGQFEKLLSEKESTHQKMVAELQNKHDSLLQQFRQEKIDGILSKHIPSYTTVPVEDVAGLMRNHFTFDEEGEMVIRDRNGQTPLNAKGDEMSAEEFIADFIAKREWLAKAAPKGGSGGLGGKGKGGSGKQVFTAEDIANMSYADFKKNEAAIMAQANG